MMSTLLPALTLTQLPLYTIALCTTLYLLSILHHYIRNLYRTRVAHRPPIAYSHIPILNHALDFGKRPIELIQQSQRQYGDVFVLRLGPTTNMTMFANPLHWPNYYKERRLDFHTITHQIMMGNFHQSAATAGKYDGQLNPQYVKYLQGKELETLTSRADHEFKRYFSTHLSHITASGYNSIDLQRFTRHMMLHVATDVLWSSGDLKLSSDELFNLFAEFDDAFHLFAAQIPTVFYGKAVKSRQKLLEKLQEHIVKSLEYKQQHPDTDEQQPANSSSMIKARIDTYAENSELLKPRQDLLSDAATISSAFMWASLANSTPVATWVVYYLLRSPAAYAAIQHEIDREMSAEEDVKLSRSMFERMPLLDSHISEVMRLTVSSAMLRESIADFDMKLPTSDGGSQAYRLQKGERCMVFLSAVQLDAQIYPDPTTYKYERFALINKTHPRLHEFSADTIAQQYFNQSVKNADGTTTKLPMSLTFLPFSTGPNQCPGRYLARVELQQLLTMLLWNFEFEPIDEKTPFPQFDQRRIGFGTLPAVGEIPVKIRRRTH